MGAHQHIAQARLLLLRVAGGDPGLLHVGHRARIQHDEEIPRSDFKALTPSLPTSANSAKAPRKPSAVVSADWTSPACHSNYSMKLPKPRP
jgi:hypothetical protein